MQEGITRVRGKHVLIYYVYLSWLSTALQRFASWLSTILYMYIHPLAAHQGNDPVSCNSTPQHHHCPGLSHSSVIEALTHRPGRGETRFCSYQQHNNPHRRCN